jgi:hypothetical protein
LNQCLNFVRALLYHQYTPVFSLFDTPAVEPKNGFFYSQE